jgi:hypothetical protein
MALILTISAVLLLVMVRLLIPPIPGVLKSSVEKFGERTTMMLCAIGIVGAVLLIVITRR